MPNLDLAHVYIVKLVIVAWLKNQCFSSAQGFYLIKKLVLPLAVRTPLRLHLFCHPSSRWSPSRLLTILAPKYPQCQAGQLFNTLPPHEDRASDIDGVVSIETGTQHL